MIAGCCPQTTLGMLCAPYYLSKIRKIMNSETELTPRVSGCGVPREGGGGGVGVFNPPPRNSEGRPKSCQTQPDCANC